MKKRLFAVLLSAAMASVAVMPAFAAEAEPIVVEDATELDAVEETEELPEIEAIVEDDEADIEEEGLEILEYEDEEVDIIEAEDVEAVEELEETKEQTADAAIPTGTIRFGQTYSSSATEDMADREQWYNMTLKRSGRLTIALKGIVGYIYNWTDWLEIYTTSGKRLFNANVPAGQSKIVTVDLDAGDYLVRTRTVDNAVFEMEFKIDFTDSKETVTDSVLEPHNSVLDAATYKPVSKSYGMDGYITINGGDDYFKFKVSKNSIVNLAFKTTQLHNLYYEVFNKEGGSVESRRDINVGTNSYDIPLKKGTYYIKIGTNDTTGKYNFCIKEKSVPKPTISSLKQDYSYLKAKWKSRSLVDGYELQISSSKSFAKSKTRTFTTGSGYKEYSFSPYNAGLKAGTTYYVRMRYKYNVGDSTFASAWSKVVSRKYKKS